MKARNYLRNTLGIVIVLTSAYVVAQNPATTEAPPIPLEALQQQQQPPPPSSPMPSDILPPIPNVQVEPARPTSPAAPSVEGNASAPAPPGAATETPADAAADSTAAIAQKDLTAVIKTSLGTMQFKLYTRNAPRTVQNFVGLATGQQEFRDVKSGLMVRRPFYNGLIFHRVVAGYMAQTGCPYGNGRGGPNYAIKDEFHQNLRHNKAGILSMVNVRDDKGEAMKDSAGSQFMISLGPQPDFDDHYSVFGEIISGYEVLRKFNRVSVGPTDRPIKRIYLQSVEIIER